MISPLSAHPNLFNLPVKAFKMAIEDLNATDLYDLGIEGILCSAAGEKLDLVFLEDARRLKQHIAEGRPRTYYKSLLEFAVGTEKPLPMVKRCVEMYAVAYPEHVRYSERSPLLELVVRYENCAVLGLLIDEGVAPPVATNGDVYMTKAIAEKSRKLVLWLVENGQDLRSFRYSLDRRGMLESGTRFFGDLRKIQPEALEGNSQKALSGLHLTVLINNVGENPVAPVFVPLKDKTEVKLTKNVSLNALFPLHLTRTLLSTLAKNGLLLQINVSAMAEQGFTLLASYSVSKQFITTLTGALWLEMMMEGRADDVEILGIRTGRVPGVADYKEPPSFFVRDAKTFAKAALAHAGHGRGMVVGYWTHMLQHLMESLMPPWNEEWELKTKREA
ncbi:hypothetical protein GGR53DRAFT_530877 [Hypoxylon sp. FL1150]|nr:hypothetical protein GGR53DRAFT_530877 [Hypoxylon sp. FL1150]